MLNKKILLLASSIIASLTFASVGSAVSSQGQSGNAQPIFKNDKPQVRSPFGPLVGPVELKKEKGGQSQPGSGKNKGPQVKGPQSKGPQVSGPSGKGKGPQSKGPNGGGNGPKYKGPKNQGPHNGNKTNVPDGGLTFAMLGSALAGLAFIKRKNKRA